VEEKLRKKKISGLDNQRKELQKIKAALEDIKNKRGKLGPVEENELKEVNEVITGNKEVPMDGPGSPTPSTVDITLSQFQTLLGISDLSQDDLDLWFNLPDSNSKYKKEAAIKNIIGKYSTAGSERTALLGHLKSEGVHGGDKIDKPEAEV